jgi:hypothetical protein
MLWIFFKNGQELIRRTDTLTGVSRWENHQNRSAPGKLLERISEVTEVQASRRELEWIRSNLDNVPISKFKSVQNWYGDMAKFIAGCLPVKF